MAWFLRLSTLPNTTQFSTFYYILLQYYFSSPNIFYLLLIFNYFFLFILNHTRLLSPWILHFILLNFITSSSTLLHLRFAFLLVHLCLLPILVQPCLFSSFEFQISQYDFFFSCTGTFVHFIFFFFFLLRFFGLQNANLFLKFVLVLRTKFFFFFKHKLHAGRILNFG